MIVVGGVLIWNVFLRERPKRKNYAPVYDKNVPAPSDEGVREEVAKLESESEYLRKIIESQGENDVLYGKTDKYEWKQGERDIELSIAVEAAVIRKSVKLDVTNKRIRISVNGVAVVEGQFFADIVAEESHWQFEEVDGVKRLEFSAPKQTPTQRNQHWRSLIKGDQQVGKLTFDSFLVLNPLSSDVSKLGPPVHAIDPDNKAQLKAAIDRVT
jgi:hypothetical protein